MKKLVSFLMSTIIIFQIVDKTCFSVTAHHIVHDFSVKEFQIDDDISLNPIEIFEGEQLQLCFTSVDKSEITYVASLSLEHKATISSDLILTGYCAGEDVLHIYIDQNGKSIDDKVINVKVLKNNAISDENRNEITRLNEFYRGEVFLRRKIELAGGLEENTPRLTMDKIKEIISSAKYFKDIYMQFNKYNCYPDAEIFSEASTRYIYWLDNRGSEYIELNMDIEIINYYKIIDNDTEITQIIYPENLVVEPSEIKNGRGNIFYTFYNRSVLGDANCDGELSMADAVLIMQSLANPDKYGENGTAETHITEQGKKNADITGENDGITNADALAIQKKLLKLD